MSLIFNSSAIGYKENMEILCEILRAKQTLDDIIAEC